MKTKGKTKLEDLEVKKIDAVDIGADQKANILIKKRGGAEEPKGNFFKRFFNAFCDSLGVNSEDVRKSMEDEATSFDDVMNEKKIYDVRDQIWMPATLWSSRLYQFYSIKSVRINRQQSHRALISLRHFRMMHPSLGSN